jgi:hypothetical protein
MSRLTVILLAVLAIPATAQRRTPQATGALSSDSLYMRVAGADRRMNGDEFVAFLKERPAGARIGELPTFADSIFARLDSDRTGWLSRAEFGGVAALVNFVNTVPAQTAAAGRGRGAKGAAAAAVAARGKKAQAAVATAADSLFTLAASGDTLVTRDEFTAFMKDRPLAARGNAAGRGLPLLFQRADADGSGSLTKAEFTASVTKLIGAGLRGRAAVKTDTTTARRL